MSKQVRINDNLIVSSEFFEFLSNMGGLIPTLILNLETEKGIGYISPTDKNDMVSYLPMNKYKDSVGFDPFDNSSRVHLKIGRLANKMIPENFQKRHGMTDSAVEKFAEQYKSWFDRTNFDLMVVEGEEIRKWYYEVNYFRPGGACVGTLWNSCMRYRDRMRFLDMYCKNPDIKMLVMMDRETQKVRARALLWEKVEVVKSNGEVPPTIKVMDRIYSTFGSDVHLFKKWAFDNGYIPKMEQNSKSHVVFDLKGTPIVFSAKVTLDKYHLDWYPYLDTFPYFDIGNGVLYNSEFSPMWQYKLVQANGTLEKEQSPDEDNEEWDD
jgi:hypothetical protein